MRLRLFTPVDGADRLKESSAKLRADARDFLKEVTLLMSSGSDRRISQTRAVSDISRRTLTHDDAVRSLSTDLRV